MSNRIQFYKLWRQVSIAMMAIVAVVIASTFMSTPSHEISSSLTKICDYKGIHFCLAIPDNGYAPLTSAFYSVEPTEGLT